jgi:hypothetical protein
MFERRAMKFIVVRGFRSSRHDNDADSGALIPLT